MTTWTKSKGVLNDRLLVLRTCPLNIGPGPCACSVCILQQLHEAWKPPKIEVMSTFDLRKKTIRWEEEEDCRSQAFQSLVPSPWLAHWRGREVAREPACLTVKKQGFALCFSPTNIYISVMFWMWKGNQGYNLYIKYCKFQSLQVTHLVLKFRMEDEHGWKRGEIAPDSQPPPHPCRSQAWQWTSQYLSKMARFKVRDKPIPFATHYLYLVSFLGESGL